MKTRAEVWVVCILILSILLPSVRVEAQDGGEEPLPQNPDIYTFEDLGYSDEILMGPYDSMRVRFSIPATWELQSGASIQLHLKNVYPDLNETAGIDSSDTAGVRLDLEYNDVVVDSILLEWVGDRTLEVNIPQQALTTKEERHEFYIYMDAGIDCRGDHETSVIVYADSHIKLDHRLTQPPMDLTLLPSPFFRKDSLVLNSTPDEPEITGTYIVVPEDPNKEEMEAVLTVSAGLGLLTGGGLPLQVIPEDELTEEIQFQSHLIYVGLGGSFNTLQDVSFPARFDERGFDAVGVQEGDGVLMMAGAPWSSGALILLISGQNGSGIEKAARAFSTGEIRPGASADLALVSDVPGPRFMDSVETDRSLADLGYENTQLSSSVFSPTGYLEVNFSIPAGQVVSGPAYVDVFYTSSPLVDYDQSGLSISMNDVPIGGIVYDQEMGDTLDEQRITIPEHLLLPGNNLLLFQSNNVPWSYCSDPSEQNTWTVIYSQTVLHIPLEPAQQGGGRLPLLNEYYEKLTESPSLDELAFVLEPDSLQAVTAAANISYELGSRMIGSIVELEAAFADNVPEYFAEDMDLVLLGRPSRIPMIMELDEHLPAPFEEGSDIVLESVFDVVYRMPDGVSLGYIQLLEAPWNTNRVVITALGTTEEGLGFAADAMVIPALRNQLSGNFAVVREEQVVSSDTRLGIGTGNISTDLMPDAVPAEVDGPTVSGMQDIPMDASRWILLAAAGASILVAAVVAAIAWRRNNQT